ncbi:energy-coupling factor transporter ATPase [Pseudogracilibacillus sp. SE30717A]|uniref:ABC transporter ATP-binding protein n=1 Tax=Pseudogracilibacillus sp. SE30717A TaxID=3098293 RepID=UPI00300E47E5
MEIFKVNNLSFRYPETTSDVISNLSFRVHEGEFIVICGPSGCGKTTLLRLLKKSLTPVGHKEGDIIYLGKQFDEWDERTLTEDVGFVFQDPDTQIVMDEVMQEIVFSMENLGYSNLEMRKRVAELVHFFGLEELLSKKLSELSGGQKQILNIVSVLLLKPKVLLLDEPTSQLDPVASKDLIAFLERLNQEIGMTIILVEHRLEDLFSVSDRTIMMDQGTISYIGDNRNVIYNVYQHKDERFLSYIPSFIRFYIEMSKPLQLEQIPLTVKECRNWLTTLGRVVEQETRREQALKANGITPPLFTMKNVYFQYEKNRPMIINNLSLEIHQGEYIALIGGNGSGKTTLLKLLLRMIKAQRGKITYLGKTLNKTKENELYRNIAFLPQNPRAFFIQDSVGKEMEEVTKKFNIEDGEMKIKEMLERLHISYLYDRHPYDCSGGEMQKAALASMLIREPDILFIDEPTKGLDPVSKKRIGEIINKLHKDGLTIVMVTHDIEFAAKHAERCAIMFNGQITVSGTANTLFKGNYFYTTTMNRVTRNTTFPEVITFEEAMDTCPNHVNT